MSSTHPIRIIDATLRELRSVAADASEAVFDVGGAEFSFSPGQYVRVTLPNLTTHDVHGPHRDFSVSSAPLALADKTLSVSFRHSESDFKKALLAAQIDAPVRISGPFGSFTLPESSEQPLVFVAGGMGIAPFMSMLRQAAGDARGYRITLLYGNKDAASAAHLSEIKEIAARQPSLSLHTIFGPIDEGSIREHIGMRLTPCWFLAGPPAMVAHVHDTLIGLGISAANIRTEIFTGYQAGEAPQASQNVSPAGRMAAIFDALDSIALVSETDLDGTITYANDRFVEVSKYSRDELLGQTHRILKSGFHPDEFYAELWRTIASGKVFHGEVKNRAKDGSYYWVDSGIAPIFGPDKKISGYIAARFPVTERKKTEEDLREKMRSIEALNADLGAAKKELEKTLVSAKLLSEIVQKTSQPFGMADPSGRLVDVNEAFVRLLGYAKDDLLRMKYVDIIAPAYRDDLMRAIQSASVSGGAATAHAEFVRKDGTAVYVSVAIDFYVEQNAPKYIYTFLTDISELKQKEDEIRAQVKELDQINQIMIGRELRMIELKKEIKRLSGELHHDD